MAKQLRIFLQRWGSDRSLSNRGPSQGAFMAKMVTFPTTGVLLSRKQGFSAFTTRPQLPEQLQFFDACNAYQQGAREGNADQQERLYVRLLKSFESLCAVAESHMCPRWLVPQ